MHRYNPQSSLTQIVYYRNYIDEKLAQVVEPDQNSRYQLACQIISARRARAKLISSDLFGEPAWDMLLNLYAMNVTFHKVSVSKSWTLFDAPQTTTSRYVQKLEEKGFVVRVKDRFDARRIWLELSEDAKARIELYLDEIISRLHDCRCGVRDKRAL